MASIPVLMEASRTPNATFAWKVAPPGGVSAQVAGAEVTAIIQRDGVATASALVEAARPADSPLHPAFEWDDAVAAAGHRQAQAEHLIRSLVVVYRKPDGEATKPTRYLVNLRRRPGETAEEDEVSAATGTGAYVPVERVMANEVLRRRYVRQAYGELLSWRRRYEDIREMAAVFDAIDAIPEPPA